ncbi:organic hydroperoxide reductase OsmC/OhrA [Caulobacter ginsengisoli]|uniref:Organic hydroperoxide reductase OsmC/OhrA n=1 Tax=Caulobacter ginsengisoli TaxID=400775 RepID=A0ABU0IRM3_9CAUL|nr:OsmC family protein [Caulobacter ginsengisoli]MDQ0464666.1 organic hydroperoxide reductase OsmC/OhrA [Caulobacter ginsengisoli]
MAHSYFATIDWKLAEPPADFLTGRYSRAHTLSFDGGAVVPGSPSPGIVPLPWSDASAVDPEELFVAALSNCHMLTFLHKAREAGFVVTAYRDEAEGKITRIAPGRMAVTHVALRPAIVFEGRAPTAAELDHLHHAAHEDCFIANSVKTEVVVEQAL